VSRSDPSNERTDGSQVLLSRIAKIQHKVDSLEQTTAFALRKDSDQHQEQVRKIFGRSKRRARVYLAANAARSVQDIAKFLGVVRPNVSLELRRLQDEGLLEVVDAKGSSTVYAKTALARTLRIPPVVAKLFNLDPTGRKSLVRKRTRKAKAHK
jgi:hypothetical protein